MKLSNPLSKILFGALFATMFSLLATSSGLAQVLTITATGTVTAAHGYSVSVGDTFTETFTINLATPVFSSGSGYAFYNDHSGTGTLSVDSVTINGNGDFLQINSGGTYGYRFSSSFPIGGGLSSNLSLYLASSNPAVAPSTALSSIQEFPISDFTSHSEGMSSVNFIGGNITSYSVTQTVPEPSTWAMLVVGFALLLGTHPVLRRHANQFLKKNGLGWSLAVILGLLATGAAHAQVLLYNNLGQTSNVSSNFNPGGTTWWAQAFSTGSSSTNVTSIDALLINPSGASVDFTASIYSSTSGDPTSFVDGFAPNSQIGSFSTITIPASGSDAIYSASSAGIALSSNSTYWVVYQATGNMDWQGTNSNGVDSGSLFSNISGHTLAASNNGGNSWSQGNNHLQFSLSGATVAVPEPSTWTMMFAGFGLLGLVVFLKRVGRK